MSNTIFSQINNISQNIHEFHYQFLLHSNNLLQTIAIPRRLTYPTPKLLSLRHICLPPSYTILANVILKLHSPIKDQTKTEPHFHFQEF